MKKKSCTAIAPSSTANLGPGYDVFGLALDALYDRVRITKAAAGKDGSRIAIKMSDSAIPSAPESNSAGLVIKKMAQDF
ncbi:MAG TPA: homoserine kinase, partial [Nitrososphaera sp.]|nr:homoserine kinase [Nitrososphaera sp.]